MLTRNNSFIPVRMPFLRAKKGGNIRFTRNCSGMPDACADEHRSRPGLLFQEI